jgi:hypothetical protein
VPRAGLAALLACVALSPAAGQPAPDSLLLHTAGAVVRTAPACAASWPGYWSPAKPFMLTREAKQAMLLVLPAGRGAEPGWTPVPPARAPRELHGRAYFRTGFPAGFGGFHIMHRVGGLTLPAVPVENRPLAGNVYLLVHEGFHAFQLERFTVAPARTAPDAPRVRLPGSAAAEFEALAEVERVALTRALRAPSAAQRTRWTRAYLALRAKRTGMAPHVVEFERGIETTEGLADLVAHRCAAAAAGHPPGRAAEYVVSSLVEPKPALLQGEVSRWRGYGVGAAMGMLLEAERAAWRERAAAGAALDELLARAAGCTPGRCGNVNRALLEELGYAEILTRVRSR